MTRLSNRRRLPAVVLLGILIVCLYAMPTAARANYTNAPQAFPANFDLSTLDGSLGFQLSGDQPGDEAGWSVAAVGDVNGDNVDDFVIGARNAESGTPTNTGGAYLVFGSAGIGAGGSLDLATLDGSDGVLLHGGERGDAAGWSVGGGDFNGDGLGDVVIGARNASPASDPGFSYGRVYVIFGAETIGAGGTLDLTTLDGSNGFTIDGIDRGDWLGQTVGNAGNFNGDRFDDLLVCAPGADRGATNSAGECAVIFGAETLGSGGSFDLSSIDGLNGVMLLGEAGQAGSGAAGIGDFNGDMLDDVAIGAPNWEAAGRANSDVGIVYVVFGSASFASTPGIALETLDGSDGFAIPGIVDEYLLGDGVAGAGDVNSDTIADVIVGAPGDFGSDERGEAYIVYGGALVGSSGSFDLSSLDGSNGVRIFARNIGDQMGTSVGGPGDVNGDGIDDALIGAPYADLGNRGAANEGEAYVVYGGPTIGTDGELFLRNFDGTNGFTMQGAAMSDLTGFSVGAAGDVNGDSVPDFLVGAPVDFFGGTNQPGGAYLLFGQSDYTSVVLSSASAEAGRLGGVLWLVGLLGAAAVGVRLVRRPQFRS